MYEKNLFKCDLNCPECEKEYELRTKPNQKEQFTKFDEVIEELNIFNSNNIIESIQAGISALEEDTDYQKLHFIKKCSREYIKALAKKTLNQDNIDFILTNFKEFLDYTANKILENSK
ncbi:MAG TPA: hypothetical protein PKL13_01130 [bacterium]|nr:hypothetical protein [bacterium]